MFENLRRQADALDDDRVILGNVLSDQNARLGAAQHRAEASLYREAIAQIFAIMLDQDEKIEDRATVGRRSAPLLNARQAFGPRNQRACLRSRMLRAHHGRTLQSSLRVYEKLAFDLGVDELSVRLAKNFRQLGD